MRRCRVTVLFPLAALVFLAGGCSSSSSGSRATAMAPSISTQPLSATVTAGQSATFSVTVTGTGPFTYQWQENNSNISGATQSSYTTPATSTSDSGETFDVVVTNSSGSTTSAVATLTVNAVTSFATDVLTHHYDISRSGANVNETVLTTSNVNSTTFGKIAEFTVDGQIDGQILFLNQVSIPSVGTKNVLYFATENDSVYAVDADSVSGSSATVLWKKSALLSGESTLSPSDSGCGYINPVGIMSTPVIDRTRNAIYVVAGSKDGSGNVHHRLHAFDLTNGNELFGGPTDITATFPGKGGNSNGTTVTFLAKAQQQRAALLESNGMIYTAWSGYYGDCGNYSAWVIAFSANTLAQTGAIDLVPNSAGAGSWMGGGGPAADAAGNVYLSTGNAFGGNTPGITNDYGDTFVKLGSSATLTVADYFAPSNAISDDSNDEDLGSAAPLLLPDLVDSSNITRHLAVIAGKDGAMYVVNRDNMGQYNAMQNSVYQEFASDGHENFCSPVYFNGNVYLGPSGLPLKAFAVSQAMLSTSPTSQTAFSFGSNGTVPTVSANGTTNGIVWALNYESGELYAYDATNLTKVLYISSQAAGNRDSFSNVGGHFITPMVANGKVYLGTGSTVVVFGLLP